MDIFTIACASPHVALGNPVKNADTALHYAHRAVESGANILLLPHNQLTGRSLGDIAGQPLLLDSALRLLTVLADSTSALPLCVVTSLPVQLGLHLLSCAALLCKGEIFLHPLEALPADCPQEIHASGHTLRLHEGGFCDESHQLVFGFEYGDPARPRAAERPYPLMLRPETQPWLIDDAQDIPAYTRRYGVTLAQANGGLGESSADFAWRRSCVFCDPSGDMVSEESFACFEADMQRGRNSQRDLRALPFTAKPARSLSRRISDQPFLDACRGNPSQVVDIAAQALASRLAHIHSKGMVLGVSGGIDSTLSLIICARAAKLANLPSTSILGITMPGFGTSPGTHENALLLMQALQVEAREISIVESVRMHFRDIGHEEEKQDVTYENAQARERGQIVMDLANQRESLAIGPGDMSELAMGFSTLGGDHLSMYGVLGGIPKTVARACLEELSLQRSSLRKVLRSILDTPVSPELLPPKDGIIAQRTEEILGPYPIIDFYLYHMLYHAMAPEKLLFYAGKAFQGKYSRNMLLSTLRTFMDRFFQNQHKRDFLPDGPAVFRRSFSPRCGFLIPSDMDATLWQRQARELQ